jgi:hypothetical protein
MPMSRHFLGAHLLSISIADLEMMQNLIRGTLELRSSL